MAYEKLEAYIAAYNRGEHIDVLISLLGLSGTERGARTRTYMFNQTLLSLGVIAKRKNVVSQERAEHLRKQIAEMRAKRASYHAEFKAWKAQRAANSIAAE